MLSRRDELWGCKGKEVVRGEPIIMGITGQPYGINSVSVDVECDATEEGGDEEEQRHTAFFIVIVWG